MNHTPQNMLGREDLQVYILNSTDDILDVLQTVRNRAAIIHSHVEPAAVTALTKILGIDTRDLSITLALDRSDTDTDPDVFLATENLLSETSLGTSHVQFLGNDLRPLERTQRPSLRVPLPSRLLHVQRRNNYRLAVPADSAMRCTVPAGSGTAAVSYTLYDISGGGICLLDDAGNAGLEVGKVYPNCILDLPNVGTVTVALQVAHMTPMPSVNDKPLRRIGCAFVQLNGAMTTLIQRSITQLEREEIARRRGFL